MSAGACLEIKNVTYKFDKETAADAIDLRLEPGQITTLVGPSGAGKSTVLKLIGGILPVHSGHIVLAGRRLSTPTHTVAIEDRKIGLIFQDFALFPHMTALENICFGLLKCSRAERERTARDWLTRLQLESRASAYPHQLSGGEQQRVAIARALAAAPDTILLDEPFSGLDPGLREAVRANALETIRAAHIPALMVTHDPGEALAHSDKVAVMHAGRLVQTGPGDHLYARPQHLSVMQALGPAQPLRHGDLPPDWQALLPGKGHSLYARPEAFFVTETGDTRFTIERLYSNGPNRFAQVRRAKLKCLARVDQALSLQVGEECRLHLDTAHIHAFDTA